jgi:DnaK suppressor protein
MAKPVKKTAAAVKKSAKPVVKSKPAPKTAAKPVPKAAAKKPAAKPAKPAKPAAKPVAKKPGVVSKLVQAVIGAGKKVVAKTAAKPAAKPAPKSVAKPAAKPVAKAAPAVKPVAPKVPVSVTKTVTVKPEAAKPAAAKSSPAAPPVIDTRSAAARGVPVAKAYAVAKAVVAEVAPKPGKKPVASTTSRKQEPLAVRVDLPKGFKPSSKEPYMGALQQEYFRQKLTNWRVELVEESKQTIDNLRDEVRDVGDEAERATRETENSLELRTRDRYRKLISKIDEALRRIDEGAYGYCVDTGDEIGLERLEARPTAERTVDAQERWEHRQKQMGD